MCLACLLLLRYLCIWIFIKKYLMVEDDSWQDLVQILIVPAIRRNKCQNQRMANTSHILSVVRVVVRLYLVIDDVEGEDTDGVLTRLTSAKSSKSDVVASGDLGEDLAHRVEGGVE